MKADDNGTHISKGNNKKYYFYDPEDGACIIHKHDDVMWFYNRRVGNRYEIEFVPRSKVYELTRCYRNQ